MLTIHQPHVRNDVVMAAVTVQGTTERLRVRVPGLIVTDKDINWTRGVAHASQARDTWLPDIEEAELGLAAALGPWLESHADSLPEEFEAEIKPMARRTKNGLVFFMFRNQREDGDGNNYAIDDSCDFDVELREIRRSSTASGFTAIWRVRSSSVCAEPRKQEEKVDSGPVECEATEEQQDTELIKLESEDAAECGDVEEPEDVDAEDEEDFEDTENSEDSEMESLKEEIGDMRRRMDTIMDKISRRD
jgi:hypothetical protein